MIYRIFLIIAALGVTIAYALAPAAKNFAQPDTARILFFHAPEAMLCTLFFLWGAIQGGRYLKAKTQILDVSSLAAIEVGFILCSLATLTGMVFAYEQWGVAWNWDPRQLAIFIQLLIYAAYFALRGGFSSKERAASYAAAYSIFSFITVPFLIWILPRLPQIAAKSQHGGANQAVVGGGLDPTYRAIFYSCAVVILLVSVWAYKIRVRQALASSEMEDLDEARADNSALGSVVRPVRLRDVE